MKRWRHVHIRASAFRKFSLAKDLAHFLNTCGAQPSDVIACGLTDSDDVIPVRSAIDLVIHTDVEIPETIGVEPEKKVG